MSTVAERLEKQRALRAAHQKVQQEELARANAEAKAALPAANKFQQYDKDMALVEKARERERARQANYLAFKAEEELAMAQMVQIQHPVEPDVTSTAAPTPVTIPKFNKKPTFRLNTNRVIFESFNPNFKKINPDVPVDVVLLNITSLSLAVVVDSIKKNKMIANNGTLQLFVNSWRAFLFHISHRKLFRNEPPNWDRFSRFNGRMDFSFVELMSLFFGLLLTFFLFIFEVVGNKHHRPINIKSIHYECLSTLLFVKCDFRFNLIELLFIRFRFFVTILGLIVHLVNVLCHCDFIFKISNRSIIDFTLMIRLSI
jgi:hypothetical protein